MPRQIPKTSIPMKEPYLDISIYESILEIISNMSLAMERSPNTFSKLKEEEIRDFFLIMLNAHFEGSATGETFNCTGKTDILIRHENKNAFIAECKFWSGRENFIKTIDQLLGYTSWRDTKTAILIFNKNIDTTTVLSRIEEKVKTHECYLGDFNLKSSKLDKETTFSYKFHHPDDKSKELILSILVFDIPQ